MATSWRTGSSAAGSASKISPVFTDTDEVRKAELVTDERGTTLVEYAVIAALVAGVCFVALLALGNAIGPLLHKGSNAFGN